MMFWNKLKIWQKGFIVGAIIHMVYLLILIPRLLNNVGEDIIGWLFVFTELIPAVTIFPFMESFFVDSTFGIFTVGLIVTLIYGLIGTLIGLIVQKFKSKK